MNPLSGKNILFLPGLDGTGISFEPLAAVLPTDVSVQVVHYPTDRLLSFEETVQCARDQILLQEKMIVIAESFSGPVAIALAVSGRLRITCLVLCATFARAPRPVLLKVLSFMPLEPFMKLPLPRFLMRHVVEGGAEAADLFLAFWQRVKVTVPAKVLAHRLSVVSRIDVRPLLPQLTEPCLYIQATSDRSIPASAIYDFTEAVSDIRVARIKGPHFILQAQPEKSLAAIQNFVALISRTGRTETIS